MAKFCSNCALPLMGLDHALFCPSCHQDLGRQPANALTLRGPGIGSRGEDSHMYESGSGWQPVAFDGGGTWRRYHTLRSSVPLALPAPSDVGGSVTASRRSPARTPEFVADVLVPPAQAALIGLAISILTSPLPWMVSGLPWWSFAPVGVGTFAVAMLLILRSNRSHLWSEETVTQDAVPAAPASAPAGEVKLIISRVDANGRFIGGLNLTLPEGVSPDAFREFARTVTRRGGRLAVIDWTGKGNPFSKGVYGKLLATLIEAGIVEDTSAGRRLTDEGRAALVGYSE